MYALGMPLRPVVAAGLPTFWQIMLMAGSALSSRSFLMLSCGDSVDAEVAQHAQRSAHCSATPGS
jgi:hypothetical protein